MYYEKREFIIRSSPSKYVKIRPEIFTTSFNSTIDKKKKSDGIVGKISYLTNAWEIKISYLGAPAFESRLAIFTFFFFCEIPISSCNMVVKEEMTATLRERDKKER